MKSSIPCCYKVLLGGEEVINGRLLDHDSYRDENHFIYFEGMGEEGKGIYYDDIYIHPRNITLTNDGRMVTFRQKVGDQMFKGWCEFVGKMGYGHFEFGLNRGYAVTLRPWAVPYEVQISTGAGAYYSSSGNKLVWDTDSQEWKNAVWESGQMVFAYDVYEKKDPVSGIVKILECRYTDTGVTGTPFWELTENIGYSAEINASNLMTINAINEVPPDPDRKKMPIPSVFPKKFQVQFDDIGLSFQGAYLDDDGKVYAVKGRAQRLISGSYTLDGISTPVSVFGGKLAVDGRVISSSHQAGNRVYWSDMKENTHEFPSSGFLEFSENCDRITGGFASGERMEGILKKPEIAPAVFTSSEGDSLDIYGLIGMNPMKMDSSGNWYDDVGQESMKDFYKIIVNFMDRNLRESFIPVSVPELTPELRQIAYDEPQSSTAFYNKTMQIPYLVRTLSNSTLDQAKYLNGSRAGKQLKQGCANNDVYKRHADKLYRLHWKKTFPNTDTYLEDQETTDYTEKINGNFNYLKDIIHERMKCAVDSDREKRLKDLMDEMDGLNQWALEKNVYWAFILYYHLTIHWIPVLEGKLKDGNLSQDVTQQIKNYSSLFNILEGTESNPKGKTFNEAFLDTIRAFQLATIIPQYVDYTANDDYFSEILGSIFDEFMKQYGNTTDPDLIENVQNVRELLQDRELTRMFVSELATSIRVLGANASWDKIVTTFQGRCQTVFSKVSGFLIKGKIILCSMGIAGFVLVLAEGKFSSLTLSQKAIFISSSVSLFANVLVGISRGIIRLYALWRDFNGFFHGVKVFFGFDGYLAALPSASSKIGNSFAKWFVRSKNEVMQMQQDGDFGKISKIFGRNVNEFMAETMGAALSIITIIFCAI
ncbi:MAG TPA: hypothetical protein VHT34_06520, partial [Clostridia bacterium]|nr:hypothetical protein [Clostridia bacterium]